MDAINTSKQNNSPEAIERDVDYALLVGNSYRQKINDWMGGRIAGTRVLELGPGPTFGSTLVLSAYGAEVSVSDRWLAVWDDEYHIPFYSLLAAKIKEQNSEADTSAFQTIIEAKAHLNEIVGQYKDAEFLDDAPTDYFDLVISNAVYEHIVDIDKASKNVFNVTKKGGLNIHQVDLRDHRDFSKPLEYLLMSEAEIIEWQNENEFHQGSQRRESDYTRAFSEAGFEIRLAHVTEFPSEEYLSDFKIRLAEHPSSPYKNITNDDLLNLSVCYILNKN